MTFLCTPLGAEPLALPSQPPDNKDNFSETLLDTAINGEAAGDEAFLFLKDQNDELLALESNLENWRFIPLKTTPTKYKDFSYQPLSAYDGLTYKINSHEMSVAIDAPSTVFQDQSFSARDKSFITPTPPPLGGFLDYDLLGEKQDDSSQLSGLFTGGVFSPFGHGNYDFLARQSRGKHQSTKNEYIRLNTAWRYEAPQSMRAYLIGDSYTTPGTWGRSVGFGGFQIGRDFATQPAFITFPLPSTSGEATVPSTVELYVNDALVGKQKVDAGPFNIDSIPTITGGGDVNVVTTDLLGRQQTLTLPYYVSNTLLTPGLHDYSIEGGFIRKDFGVKSNKYGRFAFVGFDRFGVTENFTTEIRGEFVDKQQAAGIGGTYLVSQLGVLNAAIAGSTKSNHQGGLFSFGFERKFPKNISLGFNNQITTKRFEQLGIRSGWAPKHQLASYIGLPPIMGGTLGFTYTRQDYRNQPDVNLLGANYNQRLTDYCSLNVSAITNIGGRKNQSIFVTLTFSLGSRTTMSMTGQGERDSSQGTVQVTQSLPPGNGFGYSASGTFGKQEQQQASVSTRTDIGTYKLSGARREHDKGARLEASGGIVLLGGIPHLTRKTGRSFALVQVPGYADVAVYEKNQIIARTDSDGNAFIPDLLPYQKNSIRIEPNDLPLDAEVPIAELKAIPYEKSGLILKFPVKELRAALATFKQHSGDPVPPGAFVKGGEEDFIVTNAGRVYLKGLEEENHFEVHWEGNSCKVTIPYEKTDDPLPDLGTITCE